jgi:hypothetical protein
MTNEQNDAVLETLTRIAANQTEMRRDLQRLVRRVARIEERLDGADKHLHRIERCLKMWRGRGRAMAADRAAAETRPAGIRAWWRSTSEKPRPIAERGGAHPGRKGPG